MKTAVYDFRLQRGYSRAEFERLIGGAAGELHARLGQAHGQRVAALSRNGVELLVLMYACMRVGAIFVPLNWRLSNTELGRLLADCQPALLYCEAEFAPLVTGQAPAAQPMPDAFHEPPAAHERDDGVPLSLLPADDDQIVILLYTSGTTGRPKGVILTAGNVRAATSNFRAVADVGATSVLLCDSPMFHTIGLIAICGSAVESGASLLLSPAFQPDETIARLSGDPHGITHYFCVPQMLQLLRQSPRYAPGCFGHLRALFVGGAPLSSAMVETWRADGVQLINGYGSSEAGTVIHMPLDQPEVVSQRPGSVGRPAPLIEASLRDRGGRVVAPGSVGEIWLRGPSLTPGYWQQPEATRAAFSDGWYRSGDAARCDEDGYYFLVDRWKDMYISGGENVYPAEVEAVLATLPGVAEVAVVGQPDERWGEVGEAYIVRADGASLDEAGVIAFARGQLAAYKTPKRVHFVAALPRTPTGKLKKNELRRQSAG